MYSALHGTQRVKLKAHQLAQLTTDLDEKGKGMDSVSPSWSSSLAPFMRLWDLVGALPTLLDL